jgi:hypothetical protein
LGFSVNLNLNLNLNLNRKHLQPLYRALGGWTFAFSDYYALNFTGELDNPGKKLMAVTCDHKT